MDDGRFTPDGRARVRTAFGDVPADSVVCTHGEVIAGLFDGQTKCAKGAFWVVERRKRNFLPVLYVEAPAATRL